jgi:hypothetical protein
MTVVDFPNQLGVLVGEMPGPRRFFTPGALAGAAARLADPFPLADEWLEWAKRFLVGRDRIAVRGRGSSRLVGRAAVAVKMRTQ